MARDESAEALAAAGASYAGFAFVSLRLGMMRRDVGGVSDIIPPFWPWPDEEWKPEGDPVADIEHARDLLEGALEAIRLEDQKRADDLLAAVRPGRGGPDVLG